MKVLFILDEDDKYGAAKAGIEMILTLRKNHNVTPVVITSKKNNINSICNYYNIENYVTKHHKFVFSLTNSKMNNIIKYIPRYIICSFFIYTIFKTIFSCKYFYM